MAPPIGWLAGRTGRSLRAWRRDRPFVGGLLILLSGLELLLSANLDLGNLALHVGPQGFLSYVIPAMMLLCGVLIWAQPQLRYFFGALGLLVATYSLIGLNLGGFLLGLMLGILGGALTIAWTPARTVRPAAATPAAETEGAGHRAEADAPEHEPTAGGSYRPDTLALILVPAALVVTLLVSGGNATPAVAAPAPPCTNNRPTTPTPTTPTTPTPTTSAPVQGGRPTHRGTPRHRIADASCLGPAVFRIAPRAADPPVVATRPGVLTATKLQMHGAAYDGVTTLPRTGGNAVRVLQFSMREAINDTFQLAMDEPHGRTIIRSTKLTTSGNVKFFTTRFTGKLVIIPHVIEIPVTYTPDQPPPLMLPDLTFKDVTIDLAYVRCDTLTAEKLKITPA